MAESERASECCGGDWERRYLSDEALHGSELIHGDGHLPHVVGHVEAAIQRVGGDGVGDGLVERLEAMAERLLRLLRRLLQRAHAHYLLLRQWLDVPQHHLKRTISQRLTSIQLIDANN